MHVIDRRENPKAKSLGNRQRFVRRAKRYIRSAVRDAIKQRGIADLAKGEEIRIDATDLREPTFSLDGRTGKRTYVLPGNHSYQRGDRIRRPPGGGGGRGQGGSPDGEGIDSFGFTLSRDEFLDLFFEDLELPNLAEKKMKSLLSTSRVRGGFSPVGAPQRLNKRETMRRSLARRIALHRPKFGQLESLRELLEQAEAEGDQERAEELRRQILFFERRMRAVTYLEEVDLRFNRFDRLPKPITQAVMFCLMDTSASMTESLKDLAKRFYMLLHLFLNRHYREVDLVFIRHTNIAAEVDEETFFHSRDTGGTVVSSALEEMLRIVNERYPADDWNIYAAQASDGHNFEDDIAKTLHLLHQKVLPLCQYFAYVEVCDRHIRGGSLLWNAYTFLTQRHENFVRASVSEPSEIFPVFRKLFEGSRST